MSHQVGLLPPETLEEALSDLARHEAVGGWKQLMTLQPNSDVTSCASDRTRGASPPLASRGPTLREWDWIYLAFFCGSIATLGLALAVTG